MARHEPKIDKNLAEWILGAEQADTHTKTAARAFLADQDDPQAAINLEHMIKTSPVLATYIAQTVGIESRKAARRATAEALEEAETLRQPPELSAFDAFFEGFNAEEEPGRTEVTIRLYWTAGSASEFQKSWRLGPEQLRELGPDLGLEEKAQEWAEAANRWGAYQWKICGVRAGRKAFDTTRHIRLQAPPDYVEPEKPAKPERELEALAAPPDPLAGMNQAIGLITQVAGLFGGRGSEAKGPSLAELETLKASAYSMGKESGLTEGKLLAMREAQQDQERMRRQHQEDVERAEQRGYERGRTDGAREAKDDLIPKLWEAERRADGIAPEPGVVSEIVAHLGGPEVFQTLVGRALDSLNQPKPARPHPRMQATPVPQPIQAPQTLPEPTRKEHLEAMTLLVELMDSLESMAEEGALPADALPLLRWVQAHHQAGEQEGSLAQWWKDIQDSRPSLEAAVEQIKKAELADSEQEEESMDQESMKAALRDHLAKGTPPEQIVEELRRTTGPEAMKQLRGLIKPLPDTMVAAFLGIKSENERDRLSGLLSYFRAMN